MSKQTDEQAFAAQDVTNVLAKLKNLADKLGVDLTEQPASVAGLDALLTGLRSLVDMGIGFRLEITNISSRQEPDGWHGAPAR